MLIITNTNYSNFCKKNNHDLNHDNNIVLIEFDKNSNNNNNNNSNSNNNNNNSLTM